MYMSRQVRCKTFRSGFSLEIIHLVYGCLDNIPATLKAMTSGKSTASYLRIKAHLQDGLAGGRWPPGAQMPSEAELVALFGASRMTVGRAVRELQAEGFVERVQGVGTFAAQPYRASSTLTIRDIHTEISERGRRHAARVKLVREEPLPARVAPQLGLPAGARAFHSVIVHFEDEVALLCEDRWVNPEVVPHYLEVDLAKKTPTEYLLEVAPLWKANYSIEASHPTRAEARWLGIPADAPCLVIQRRTESKGAPVTSVRMVYPGSRHALEGAFSAEASERRGR